MSEIDTANNGSQEAPIQNPISDSYSMFNDPIGVDDFFDDEIPVVDNFWENSSDENQLLDPNAAADAAAEEDRKSQEQEDELTFSDPVVSEQEAAKENKSDEELLAEIKKRGYNVTKEEVQDANAQRVQEVERLNTVIADAKNFLNLPAETIVKEKVRANLAREYQNSGKQGLIGGEEFELEMEAELEQYTMNSGLLNVFANNVRTEVQNLINENEGKVRNINSELETENKKVLVEKRTKVQNGLKAIHKSGIFGIKPTPEQSKEIYDSIISGEFTKQVNSDPNLVAEFATFLKFRENINSKLGGPTYGEGVKNAAEAINGGPLKSETSLSAAVKNSAQGLTGGGTTDHRKKSWSQEKVVIDNSQKDQKQVVAGAGAGFL